MNENENRKNDRTEATEDIKPIVIGSDGSLEGGGTRVNSGALSDKASDNAPDKASAKAAGEKSAGEKSVGEKSVGESSVSETSPTEDSKFGNRTVYIAGEDYDADSDAPFLKEGFDAKKAEKLNKKHTRKKKKSSYKTQRNTLWVLGTFIIILAIACGFVINYVNTVIYVDEADGTKYYCKKKDNPDYDSSKDGSLKKIYRLCDKNGYTLDMTPDGYYYSTEAGTLVEVNKESGKCTTIAVVDTVETETIGTNRRIMIFPHTPKSDIRSIEVHNKYGTYSFYRDENGDFQIKGYAGTAYDAELFSSLVVSTGYTLTVLKIEDPIKDANGKFTEYGLASETRTDKNGKEYTYEPAWYLLTDRKGNRHKVIVGDMLVTEGGYYVQYEGRDAVYVVSPTIADTVLEPIESLVTPMIVYPMSLNDFFDVKNFEILKYDYKKYHETKNEDDIIEKSIVKFSYIPLEDRENTEFSSIPYVSEGSMSGYNLNDNSADSALQSFYQTSFVAVRSLGMSDAALKKYGLDEPKYAITFLFNAVDDSTGKTVQVPNMLIISEKTENNTYYVGSILYNLIVEVNESSLMFLEYTNMDWLSSDILRLNIGYCKQIKIESPNFNVDFDFDNSKSYSDDGSVSSNLLELYIRRKGESDIKYINGVEIQDTKGFLWKIDDEDIYAYDSTGKSVTIKGLYRTLNKRGDRVAVVDGWITDAKGNSVSVTKDTITLRDPSGKETVFGRSDLKNFRKFYGLLLYGTIAGEVTTEATEEELAALRAQDDSKCLLKLTIRTASGRELVYRFYELTNRKSYMTINGEGNFFVLRTFVDKIIADAGRVISGEIIDSTGKY